MNGTPRQRTGGFPQTPGAAAAGQRAPLSPPDSATSSASSKQDRRSSSLPLAPENAPRPTASQPVIPLTILDAPQQRRYATAIYVMLWGWKLWDFIQLAEDDSSSVWLFLKWVGLDAFFLLGIPELRIPWLELSQSTVWSLWAGHSFVNWLLMFNIGVRGRQLPIMKHALTLGAAPAATMAGWALEGLLRPRTVHFGAPCQGLFDPA